MSLRTRYANRGRGHAGLAAPRPKPLTEMEVIFVDNLSAYDTIFWAVVVFLYLINSPFEVERIAYGP